MGGSPEGVAALKGDAAKLGVLDRCAFAGARPPGQLPVFLALADVLAPPRVKGENTPFKVYTYLASGKPIVATRIATHTQLLDDSLAFLVEPSAEGFAAGLRRALAEPGEAVARARRGLALIEREYSVERHAEKVRAAYAAIAESLARQQR